MSNNRTFFKQVKEGHLTLKDIFSDVKRRHTPEESARVLIAGTALTTPDETDMLAGWQKPFLFARFAAVTLVCMVIFLLLGGVAKGANDAFLLCMAMMVPMVLLILVWEMNIPRSISLMEVLKIVAIGGGLSLIFAIILFYFDTSGSATFAPIAEEPAKFAVVYLLLKRRDRKYILEGMLLGMAVGTGFAIVETFGYIMSTWRESLIDACAYAVGNNINVSYSELIQVSYEQSLQTAILRASNAFAGHGFYAALYSGGLMIAKVNEPISPKHLLSKSFLICFGVACVLHGLNNADITWEFFPPFEIGGYTFWSFSLVQTVVAVFCLLGMMKRGVNQVVDVCAGLNGGRVTYAVNRNAPAVKEDRHADSGSGPANAGSSHDGGMIEFLSGPMAGQRFGIKANQKITIGRAPTCSLPISGVSSVSGTHCAIALNGSMILITDLGSTNGTYVGNQRLVPQQATPVPDGGTVYLGSQSCAFRIRVL